MKSLRLRCLICVVAFLASVVFPHATFAQYKEIDHIGSEFAKECMKARPPATIVAVADLRDTDGTNNDQGHLLSLILTQAISLHIKDGFAVAEHNGFDSALKTRAISAQELTTPKSTTVIAGKINLTAVVIGDFRQQPDGYSLHLSAVRVYDSTVLYSADVKFGHDEYLDSLAKPFPPPVAVHFVKSKAPPDPADKEDPPICVRCQTPRYTSLARAAKLQATVVFEAAITDEGKIVALRPRKVAGLGLDEAAYDVITKEWKMTPGTKYGKPIAMLVPIELTFRLY